MNMGTVSRVGGWSRVSAKATDRLMPILKGSIAGGAPHTVVRSLVEQAHRDEVSRHIEGIQEVLPARIATYPLEADLPPWFRRTKAFDPVYAYNLRDVVISPSSGLVWFEDSKLAIQESVGSLHRLLGWGNVLWETNLKPIEGPSDGVSLPSPGFYHWLMESVPSFLRSRDLSPPPSTVIVSDQRLPAVDHFLDGLDEGPRGRFAANRPVRVSRLTLTGVPAYSGFVDESDVRTIQAWNKSDPTLGNASRRIYLSRRHTIRRGLANEAQLEEALAALGFEVVYAERLSFTEQAEIFSVASLVVSPHGAGLSNLVWRKGRCHVIEIFPAKCHNDCYARLSALLGFTYTPVTCEEHPTSSGLIDVPALVDLVESSIA